MLYQPPPAFPRGTLPDWGSHERRQTMPVPSFAAATDIVPVPDHSVMQHAALEGLLQGTSSQRLTAASALDLSRPAQDASPPYFSHDLAPLRDVAQGAELRYPTPDSPEGDAQADDGGSMATETAGTKDFDSSRAAVLQPPQPAEPPGSPAAAPGQEWISRPPAATPHLPPMVQPSLVHDIALHAHALFTSPRGTPQRIDLSRRLAVLLHRVTPQHLRPSAMVAPIEYYPIFESDMFTICAFALRAGASMPIHDHPEMNVFRWAEFVISWLTRV